MTLAKQLRRAARDALISARNIARGEESGAAMRRALSKEPLLLCEKTYNSSHPLYDPEIARNYPWRFYNLERANNNRLLAKIKPLADNNKIPRAKWNPILKRAMDEARTVPGFEQLMERKIWTENYLADLNKRYEGHYVAGWVGSTDASFLYWLVRTFKPKTIVQTGVNNGMSIAIMMLALAKNGPDGKIYAVDIPNVFDTSDSKWREEEKVYGTVIPEGKHSGWLVPDLYRDRVEVQLGDAKKLLPALIDRLGSYDMFYHDSDHSYDHMTFEFDESKKKLSPGGIVVADDISWNSSLWDFADKHNVPSYNFHGTIGISFFPA